MTTPRSAPETSEQRALVEWLRLRGVRHFAVPNGAVLGGRNRFALLAKLKAEGLMLGAPDLVLIDRAPTTGRPVVIEVKRQVGGKLSPAQRDARATFERKGWHYVIAWGCASGIEQCIRLGY